MVRRCGMTPDLRDLLVRVRSFLRATSALFGALPDTRRAGHLGGKARALAGEIDAALSCGPAGEA